MNTGTNRAAKRPALRHPMWARALSATTRRAAEETPPHLDAPKRLTPGAARDLGLDLRESRGSTVGAKEDMQ